MHLFMTQLRTSKVLPPSTHLDLCVQTDLEQLWEGDAFLVTFVLSGSVGLLAAIRYCRLQISCSHSVRGKEGHCGVSVPEVQFPSLPQL